MEIYDYVARQRGNDIPVFLTGDPHSENYYSWSPYAYVGNNPMKYTDPTGMDWWEDEFGKTMWQNDVTKENVPKGGKYIGESYGGFKITQQDHRIDIYFKDEKNEWSQVLGWVQTVDTSSPLKGGDNPKIDPKENYIDPETGKKHDNFPFYQSKDGYQNSLKNSKRNDVKQDISFMDNPQRPLSDGDFEWSAELSLIGTSLNKGQGASGWSNKSARSKPVPIITLEWGVARRNGVRGYYDRVTVVKPSNYHKNAINKIKY